MNKFFSIGVALVIGGCATTPPQFDSIDALTKRLNSDPLSLSGESPIISLSSNAAPKEVIASAVKMWGFDNGHIKTYQALEVRGVQLKAMPNCSAALIESDLGKKVLLFRYEQHDKRSFWWTRFYDAIQEAEPNGAACTGPRSAVQRQWESRLSRVAVGNDASSLTSILDKGGYPVRFIPNQPPGQQQIIYFLPSGNIYVMTKITDGQKKIISSRPLFFAANSPVNERLAKGDREWDEYVRKHTAH